MARLLDGAGIAAISRGRRGRSPLHLFGKYQAAGLYIPDFNPARPAASGLGRLYQLSTGLTPVAAVADVIGFAAEESKGAAPGVDLLTAGSWTLTAEAGCTATESPDGQLNLISDGTPRGATADQSVSTVVGVWYLLQCTVADATAGFDIGTSEGGTQILAALGAPVGTARPILFRATSTTTWIRFFRSGAGLTTVLAITCRSVAGNHASQATAASRGTLRQVGSRYVWRGDGTDDSLLTTLVPAAAMTLIVACEFNAVSDIAIGATDASFANRCLIQTDGNGLLAGGVGDRGGGNIFGGSDIRDIPGVAALKFDGSNVALFWKPFGGAISKIFAAAQVGVPTTTVPLRIGSANVNGTSTQPLDGDIYSVLAIQAALSDSEIAAVAERFSRA